MHPLRQHFEELISLTDEEFAYIASHFTPLSLKKNDFLLHDNKVVTHEYWVVKGLLKIYFLDANGKEHIVQFAMGNWWVTDYQAFFGKKKATLNIYCLEDTELLAITYTDKENLCADYLNLTPSTAKNVIWGMLLNKGASFPCSVMMLALVMNSL